MPEFDLGVTVRRNVKVDAPSLDKAIRQIQGRLLTVDGRLEITDESSEVAVANYDFSSLIPEPIRARRLRDLNNG